MNSVKLNTINNDFYLNDSARINKLCLKLSLECENLRFPSDSLRTSKLNGIPNPYECLALVTNVFRSIRTLYDSFMNILRIGFPSEFYVALPYTEFPMRMPCRMQF